MSEGAFSVSEVVFSVIGVLFAGASIIFIIYVNHWGQVQTEKAYKLCTKRGGEYHFDSGLCLKPDSIINMPRLGDL